MNKSFSKRLVIFASTLTILVISGTYLFFLYMGASREFPEPIYKYYLFEPNSVLESLTQGNTNTFLPQSENFEPVSSEPVEIVQWSQMDYIRIAEAIHRQFWDNTLDDWKIQFMIFRADCEYVDQGPQQAVFEFYRITDPLFQRTGFEETINIDPATKSIVLKNGNLNSRSEYSRSIDLSRLKVSANEALKMAEDSGGREARLEIGNSCAVTAVLNPYEGSEGWNIYYYNKDSTNIFEINIDEQTRVYEIIHP